MTGNIQCESCNDTFKSEHGMKIHHSKVHGESIAGDLTTCDNCGNSTRVPLHNSRRNEHNFCDKECHGEWLSDNITGESHQNYNSIQTSCSFCGEEIIREKNQFDRSENHFCNDECRGSWLSENNNGENHPNYVGGPSYYGENWDEQRELAMERDFYQCRLCRLSDDECKDLYGCSLHVHHKIPIKTFDSPEKANELWNLITYCPKCHQEVEKQAVPSPRNVENNSQCLLV